MPATSTDREIVALADLDATQVGIAGGKGAQLGELTRIPGIRVPRGFCVTTHAFTRALASPADRLTALAAVEPDDRPSLAARAAELRAAIESVALPGDLVEAIERGLAELGPQVAVAVRSSATAEDLPDASFAGQHDTVLGVVGLPDVLAAVRRCWASLYSERAVTYRRRHGIDDGAVRMAVVVQELITPDTAGVAFTADPANGNRTVAVVEATFGLGDALVSGLVTPEIHRVRSGEVETAAGGDERALTDAEVLRIVAAARRIESHAGRPQDVEWCLAGEDLWIVQSRPITTLFPIPEAEDDATRVYVSVGHQQMMTDAMTPLGLSFWQLTSRAPMRVAGGRLFVDVTGALTAPASRAGLIAGLGRSDPLIGDALQTLVDRDGFLPPDDAPSARPTTPPPPAVPPIEADPAIVDELIERARASLAQLQLDIAATSGTALFDVIRDDVAELQRILFEPPSMQVITAGMEASWWLDEHLQEWLGEQGAADTLAQSAPGNVTAAMGFALLDVADAIRPHPEVIAVLERAEDDTFLDELLGVAGGPEAREAIDGFLAVHGVRCVGEIDITRPRWCERPATLLPVLLAHVERFEAGAGRRRFDEGAQRAQAKEADVLHRLRTQPDGERKADEAKRMIDRVRTFAGYREYPKYAMVARYFAYKQALRAEVDRLVAAGVLRHPDHAWFLSFDELREVVRSGHADHDLIDRRIAEFRADESRTPPRVLTSEGEAVTGAYRRTGVPAGALVGLAVSTGVVEGRARVVRDLAAADLGPGDILVTAFTDPSWTPLFLSVAGLVTEVGGLMTHGAVIAREYGLPAVVGVQDATRLIRDGQRIRLDGTHGHVELLD